MWHYAQDGKPAGPFSEVDLAKSIRAGALTRDTLVWREGMAQWLPASQTELASLFHATSASAPPLPASVASSQTLEPAPATRKGLRIFVTLLGAAAGYAATKFLPKPFVIQCFAGTIAGLVVGLIPYFTARNKVPRFAKNALCWCCVAGCAFGLLLALPVAIILTIVGLRKDPEVQT